MTNYEKIKNMSLDDMTEFFDDFEKIACSYCGFFNECDGDCDYFHKRWLESGEEYEDFFY